VYIDFEKNEERKFDQRMEDYLNKVMTMLKDAEELLIFGPAQTRIKLGKKIQEEKTMQNISVVNEAAEDMSERQMVAHVRQYFAAHTV
jgi:stalled ribosome rescue protein Dom34